MYGVGKPRVGRFVGVAGFAVDEGPGVRVFVGVAVGRGVGVGVGRGVAVRVGAFAVGVESGVFVGVGTGVGRRAGSPWKTAYDIWRETSVLQRERMMRTLYVPLVAGVK